MALNVSRLVARALPWRRNPESSADQPEVQHAQPLPLRPEDLRTRHNMQNFTTGLCHLAGSASMACIAVLGTVGLIWTSFVKGQFEAVLFAGFTAITAYWMTVYSLAAGNVLLNIYKNAISRVDEANRENERLFRQNLRILTNLARREEGEADGDGGTEYSPSASRFRRIPLKGEVH